MSYHGDGILASDLIALLLEAVADGSDPFVVVGAREWALLADVVEAGLDVVEGQPSVVLLVRAAELSRGT